jgi:hypothetical protein
MEEEVTVFLFLLGHPLRHDQNHIPKQASKGYDAPRFVFLKPHDHVSCRIETGEIQMRSNKLSTMLLIVTLAGAFQPVLAHEQGGALSAAPSATSRWRINCFDDGNGTPSDLLFSVRAASRGRAFGVTATVSKDGQSRPVTDSKSGDAQPSASGDLAQSAGDYLVEIKKSKSVKGTMIYSLTYHCESNTGAHTGTEIFR